MVEISDCKEGDCFSIPPTYSCSWNGRSPTDSFDILFGNDCVKTETHMFMKACLDDEAVGGIVVGLALFFLFLSVSYFFFNYLFHKQFKQQHKQFIP